MVHLSVPKSVHITGLSAALLAVAGPAFVPTVTAAPFVAGAAASSVMPAEDFSPALLGMYRKVSRLDTPILRYAGKYDVDVTLARAVCMFESGGNPGLTSVAGAQGFFQVMPATFRTLRVPTNIEAGIKYLGQLVHRFGREDYALAAYNGGPSRVALRRRCSTSWASRRIDPC
jgi:soluble lytic murein transglycosylase-like protein